MESQKPRKKGINWTNPPAPYEPSPRPRRLNRPLLLTVITGIVAAGLVAVAVLSYKSPAGNETLAAAEPVVVAEAEEAPAPAKAGTTGRLITGEETETPAPLTGNDPRWGKDSPAPDAEDVAALTAHAETTGMENAYAEPKRPSGFDQARTASITGTGEPPAADVPAGDVPVAETEEEIRALEAIEGEAEAEASKIMPQAELPAANAPDRQPTAAGQPVQEPQAEEPQETVKEEDPQQQLAALPSAARPSGPLVAATTRDGVNLRSGPSNKASVVAVLVANLPIQASQNCPSWCEVVVNGRRGYVYKSFIRYGQGGAARTDQDASPAAASSSQNEQQAAPARPAATTSPSPANDPLQQQRNIR